ncbi:TonB-dependent receptor plug domain-containing protein [Corallincola platygyrae]|uniref:TonB-dependent receptor plug domain-containing protein n=1 Tax=Corallincola platygyrae TaxID=1193278 RepID=A0ABW4XLS7_9GAMM
MPSLNSLKKPRISLLALFVSAALSPQAFADDTAAIAAEEDVEKIEVKGVRTRLATGGRVADMIEKTELLTAQDLFDVQAGNLAEAIDTAPGVRVNNECSMCGMKRVMINGLKGEHTTILVDGIPMHSVVSSFYGMDAIATSGVESIEIARGSGASLIAPGAVGGTINIVTKRPYENSVVGDFASGSNGYKKLDVSATGVNEKGDLGILVTAQQMEQDRIDADGNGVSESAALDNSAASMKLVWDATDNDNIEVRYARFRSDIFGGPMGVSRSQAIASEAEGGTDPGQFFENGDVRQQYQGKPWEVTEAIDTTRDEYSARWIHEINSDWHFTGTGSYVQHGQDSYYEGFDYVNEDDVYYGDLRLNWIANDDHLLTFGVDYLNEEMRSDSDALRELQQEDPGLYGDSFDHEMIGLYVQDNWAVADNIELQLAVRLDQVTADFIEHKDVGDEIDETMISPRAHLRWDHSDEWVSRFSAGRGFRAPLTFFESDHGILEDGFAIDVDHLEESTSVGYAISYQGEQLDSTLSLAYTEVDNLAHIDADNFERPTLVNSDETIDVSTADLMWGYQVNEYIRLDGGFEFFFYSDEYKETFSVVPVEERVTLGLDIDYDGWDIVLSATWIGERDLSEYGYGDRYNTFFDLNGDNMVDPGELQDPKDTDADDYVTVDLKVSYEISENVLAYVGAKNLFDYTQAEDMDSPLYWEDADGEPAFDVAHIYGPLAGRTAYAGVKVEF